jgi:hypothetical protein
MPRDSDFRAYIDANQALPKDCVLGYIAWFSVEDAAYDAERLAKDFDRLNLSTALLPAPIRADDAFEKASKEIDRFKYAVAGDSTAEIMVRDVSRDKEAITRHLIREVKDSQGKRLLYERVGELVFYRAISRGGVVKQKSARCQGRLVNNLSPSERQVLSPKIEEFHQAYSRFKDFHDGQKIRGVLRDYLTYLNAVQMKPSVYFVHATRAEELERLKEFADGLGTASMMLLPQADLPRLRQEVIDAFQVEAEKDLALVVTNIAKLRASRTGDIRPEAYNKIKSDYDRVMMKASEYGRTLQISQDRTAGALSLAMDSLVALQADVVRSMEKVGVSA